MSRFGIFWLPWLRTAASGSCRLKSAAAVDAEDVPVAHHADGSFRLGGASTYTLTSRLSSAATDKQAEQRRDQTYCEPPPLKLHHNEISGLSTRCCGGGVVGGRGSKARLESAG